jgi:hypothetical protein
MLIMSSPVLFGDVLLHNDPRHDPSTQALKIMPVNFPIDWHQAVPWESGGCQISNQDITHL